MSKMARLVELAQAVAHNRAGFFTTKGPSIGDKDTAMFMAELRSRAAAEFGTDHSEQRICGPNRHCVDFYFPEEETVVEIALGLRNPTSEFERDILKAIMAQDAGNRVKKLVFVSKPGAEKRCSQPGARAIIEWAMRAHGLSVEVKELVGTAA